MKLANQFRMVSEAVLALILIVAVSGCRGMPAQRETSPITPAVTPPPTATLPSAITLTATPTTIAVTPTSTATPEEGEIAYPPDTRTGISHLDAIIDAVVVYDRDRILNLIHFAKVGCTTEPGFGGPPKCHAGEASGTLIDAVPTSGVSEGMGMRRGELDPGCRDCRLVAVLDHVTESFRGENWELPARYALVFGYPTGCCTILLVDDQGIVSFMNVLSFAEVGKTVLGDFILPPRHL